jgi:putative ABC transport system permease protein
VRLASFATALVVGFDTLRANPLRTALSTLGVIIGVASLVAVLCVGDGMEVAMRAQLAQTTDLQAISVQPRTFEELDGQRFPIRDPMAFTPSDMRSASMIPGVDGVSLLLRGRAEARASEGTARRMVTVVSDLGMPDTSQSPRLLAGRSLTPNELETTAALIVVSRDLARDLAADSNAQGMLGRAVTIEGTPAQVVGVLAPPERAAAAPSLADARADYRVIAPLGFAEAVLRSESRSPVGMVVHAARVEETDAIKGRIQTWLAARDTAWARRATVVTSERRLEQATSGILMFKLFMGAITGISLLVGGIGIMNVLLSSVTERTREIGIRKATGARDGDIRLQFLAESVAISSAGSAIGLVLGVSGAFAITALIRHFARAPFLHASISWSTLLVAAAVALVVGLTFGTYPAKRAARLSPIDAIRHE